MSVTIDILTSAGVKVAQLSEGDCRCTTTRKINGEWSVDLEYSIPPSGVGEDKSPYFTDGCKIKVKTNTESTFTTFTLTKPVKRRMKDGVRTVRLSGEHSGMLAFNQSVIDVTMGARHSLPATVLGRILAYCSGYTVGTVEPVGRVNIPFFGNETVISALQRLLTACGGELDINSSNAVSIYYRLGADNSVRVNVGKNLDSLINTRYLRKIVNKVYGYGGGQPPVAISSARHVVQSITTATITVTGNKVVAENDSWNTFKVKFVTGAQTGNSFVISDCTHGAVSDSIVLASTPSPAVVAGDKFIITTAGDVPVGYILAATSVLTNGTIPGVFKDPSLGNITNLIENPFLDATYSAGLCPKWTKEGTPTVTENAVATFVQYGEKSQKVIGDAANEGISQAIVITSGRYYTASAWIYIVSGTVTFYVTDGISYWAVSKNATGWQKFSVSERMASAALTVKIYQNGATAAEFYVDAVQVCEGVLQTSFTGNSNLKELWDKSFDSLMKTKDPQIEYEVNFIDLYKIMPKDYPFDKLVIGDTVTVYDSELSISGLQARIMETVTDEFNPQFTKHTVSNIL